MPARWSVSLILLIIGYLLGYLVGNQTDPNTGVIAPEMIHQEMQKSEEVPDAAVTINKPQGEPDVAEEDAGSDPVLVTTPVTDYPLLSPDEILHSFLSMEENQDLVGIVDLILGLIQQRRFSEADELIESTLSGLNGGKLNSPLWKNSPSIPFMLIRFCNSPNDYHAALEYTIHLSQLQNPPELLGDIREESLIGGLSVALLGLNDGSADHLVADLVPYYREQIENPSRSSVANRSVIQALGMIPTDESALLIADFKDWASGKHELELIQALAMNGTATAIEIMESWLTDENNPRFKLALEDALRLLE